MEVGRHSGRSGDLKLAGGPERGRPVLALGHGPAVENKLAINRFQEGARGDLWGKGISIWGLWFLQEARICRCSVETGRQYWGLEHSGTLFWGHCKRLPRIVGTESP